MKEIIKEYKEQFKYFISNKKYLITIVIVAILSYGFTVTHYAIGIDDLCFDRYVQGTYILSAKRWATWLLYNVLQINEFSPFWLDSVAVLLMMILAIVLCAFIRKQYGDKIKTGSYIIFSSLLISNPMINLFFMYQTTNIAIVISNLMVILCAIIIFENYFHKKKKWVYIVCGLLLAVPISMYESCAQTYLILLFSIMFIGITQKKASNKDIFKYFCLSIGMLMIGIGTYFVLGQILQTILKNHNILNKNFADSQCFLFNEHFANAPLEVKWLTIKKMLMMEWKKLLRYFPTCAFICSGFAIAIIETIQLIRTSKVSRMFCVLGMIFSNFILIFIQLKVVARAQFSWIIAFGFMGLYIYQILANKKILKYIVNIVAILLIIIQTRLINQYFYNDYKRYEKDKSIANDVAISVIKNCEYENKPLYYVLDKKKGKNYKINYENSDSVIAWGIKAFDEPQTETTKFINEQGYHFKYLTQEDAKNARILYEQLDTQTKEKAIIELENVIIVNLNIYDF